MKSFQKYFLILLSTAAIIAAVLYFTNNIKSAADKNREAIIKSLDEIVLSAQTFYKRTNKFTGWSIPASMQNEKVGIFRETVRDNKVIIYASGIEIGENQISNVNVECIVTPNDRIIKIRN